MTTFLLVYIAVVVTLILLLVAVVTFVQLENIDIRVEKLVAMEIEKNYPKDGNGMIN